MSQKYEVMSILSDYEDQRKSIIESRYSQLEDLYKRFEELKSHMVESIIKLEEDNQERAKSTQYLAEIANEFYQKMQRMMKKF